MSWKRFSLFFVGCLALSAVALVSLSWYQSTSTGGKMSEWWSDVAEVRSFNDLTMIVSGENAQQRETMRQLRMQCRLIDSEQPTGITSGNSDSPLLGGTPQRNMINTIDKNIPVTWNVEDGKLKNIKWSVELGTNAYGGPVIAGGKVYVGTNNARDKKDKEPWKAVIMAFNEADGKFLWKLTHESPDDDLFNEGRSSGMISTPAVEGQHVYYVTPGCEVVCADTTGKVVWKYDMYTTLKVHPHHLSTCSPVIVDDHLMVMTGNGVNEEFKVVNPKAPSFIAINKKTGKLAWQSNLPGSDIIEGQFSNPTVAVVGGKKQVIFPGGDCVLYSFEPDTGKLIWKCDCNPTRVKGKFDNPIVATPVVVGDRLFLGLGSYPGSPESPSASFFLCLDITKKGDVSLKNYDPKSPANKDSALVWLFGGLVDPVPAKGRRSYMGPTASTACVHDGLVYIAESSGYLHCLDAKTGKRYWDHDFKTTIWGSAYYVDGKVYLGTEDGDIYIFAPGKERKWYQNGKLRTPDGSKDDNKSSAGMEERVYSTPVVANGVLYIQTRTKLYAIK